MDANRFDTLSRQVGTATSRRGVLRLVGALPLLGALASLTSEQTGAETPLMQRPLTWAAMAVVVLVLLFLIL